MTTILLTIYTLLLTTWTAVLTVWCQGITTRLDQLEGNTHE